MSGGLHQVAWRALRLQVDTMLEKSFTPDADGNASSTPSAVTKEPTFCAKRGGQWLTPEDFQAHLACLLRLDNIGVLLGSGASMGTLGGMTMAELWEHFRTTYGESATWLQDSGFMQEGNAPNVEKLADAIEVALLEWQRAKNAGLSKLEEARADLLKAVIHAALLKKEWWEDPSKVDVDVPELMHHRALLQKLTAARQPGQPAPWVFTTNYDLAVEWAAESINLKIINGFDGLHRRGFSPHNFDLGWRNVLARGEARFGTYHIYLAKVHGSLSWHREGDGTVVELPTLARWPVFKELFQGDTSKAAGLLVLPSAAKYMQTVGFVLGELFRRLAEFLARSQTAIITNGYSFSDDHLNRLLITALQNPTLQLVMYLPEARRDGDSLDLSVCSEWARRVLSLKSPQVTVVGGGADAYFCAMARQLPEPVVYDEQSARIRTIMKELRTTTDSDRQGRA